MLAQDFISRLNNCGISYFTGVPDSLLNALCLELINTKSSDVQIGVNEGNCLALAAGRYMATGNIPCVFMQNSGLGNIVNPFTSLTCGKVYGIPTLFIVGWRGEPGVKDEPQHVFMGEITLKLLELMGINYQIIDEGTTLEQVDEYMRRFSQCFKLKQSCAFVVKKGAFTGSGKNKPLNDYGIIREQAIESIINKLDKNDIVVSSTGKISRELFEVRERLKQPHLGDFLTIGSMGYASSIAAQIAYEHKDKRVVCIDGDGAALMHLGCMATIGSLKLDNFIHIILDNELHESVGGVPTISGQVDWAALAKSCGYKKGSIIYTKEQLDGLKAFDKGELIVIKVNQFSRADLGRPTITAQENLNQFISHIKGEN